MPLIIVAAGVVVLLCLIVFFRMNAFIALMIVALGVGVAQGSPVLEVIDSIQKGVGGTLSSLALILGFGAMLGGLIAETGAAQVITERLTKVFGVKYLPWALILTGFIVGIPMFYTVGFVMLIPLIFTIAIAAELPLVYVGIPMIAALSVTHGFLPPHPAPTAIAVVYNADIGLTLLYGLILAIPTIILAGPVFGYTLRHFKSAPPKKLFSVKKLPIDQLPSFGIAVFTALVPVFLMGIGAIGKLQFPEGSASYQTFAFIGNPVIAMLMAVLVGIITLGILQGKKMEEVNPMMINSVKASAMILLIIAGGGAFKQVLVDSGISNYIVQTFEGTQVSPLFLAWLIAAALRIALGSATVAALTAAGIAAPLIGSTDVSPELLVLATGAGSLTFSQVNDTGFWLFKEYFNLTIGQTFRTWTVIETIVSIAGLAGCLLLDMLV